MKKRAKVDDVKFIRYHDSLSEDLVRRIKRLHPIISEVLPWSLDEWVNGFHYDMHPEREVRIWERMLKKFESRCKMQGATTKEEKQNIFGEFFKGLRAGNMVISEDVPSA